MTQSINSNVFIRDISQLYCDGQISLDDVSQGCLSKLNRIQKRYQDTGNTLSHDQSKDDYKNILFARDICAVCINAKENYYKNSSWGQIAFHIQIFLKKHFGYQTTLDRAKEAHKNCLVFLLRFYPTDENHDGFTRSDFEDELNHSRLNPDSCLYEEKNPEISMFSTNEIKQIEEEASFETIIRIARELAKIEGKTKRFVLEGTESDPKHMIFAKPNGDVYSFKRDLKFIIGTGKARNIYKGTLFSKNQSPKTIATQTTFPRQKLDECDPDMLHVKNLDAERMIKEEHQQHLQKLKHEGIIKVHDFFSWEVQGTKFAIAFMDLYDSDLDKYLKNDKKGLTIPQKKSLIGALIETFDYLHHQQKKLHRDVSEKNILIKEDGSELKAILTDFESCIDFKDKRRKQEVAYTQDFMAPEYAKVCEKNSKDGPEIAKVTSDATDIWALGLIFYHIWFGTSLMEKIYPISDQRADLQTQQEKFSRIKNLNSQEIEKAFQNDGSEISQMIRSMLTLDPKQRASAHRLKEAWEKISGPAESEI